MNGDDRHVTRNQVLQRLHRTSTKDQGVTGHMPNSGAFLISLWTEPLRPHGEMKYQHNPLEWSWTPISISLVRYTGLVIEKPPG